MNIAFLEDSFTPTRGGVERVTFTIGESLRSKGYGVYYIFRGVDSADSEAKYKYRFNNKVDKENQYTEIKDYIQKKYIKIIICQNLHTSKYSYIYNKLKHECSIKIITVLHCNPDIWVNKNKWGDTTKKIFFKELLRSCCFSLFKNPYKERQKKMYEISDKYILLSEKFIPIFCKLNKVDGSKLSFIENPCFLEEDKNTDIRKENIVLIVARMAEQQKRILSAIKIWDSIYRLAPDWKMVIVGDGPDLNFYKAYANKKKMERISFMGSSKHVENYYEKAKIFMMTSIWEGFGLTLVEAQHYGCVPLAYDSYAAVSDIIKNGKNGFIIPLHNTDEYIEKLLLIMKDDKLFTTMSQCARESSKKLFNKKDIVNKWDRLLKELQ